MGVNKTRHRKRRSANLEQLSIGDWFAVLTPVQLWSICAALGCLLISVAGIAFWLGQVLAGRSH